MVRLKAKGHDPFLDALLPANMAEAETVLFLAVCRNVLDAAAELAQSESAAAIAALETMLTVKSALQGVQREVEDMLVLIRVMEGRVMSLE